MATIAEIASGDENFQILVAALGFIDSELDAGLVDTLSDPLQDLTVFAPTDAAFGALAADLGFDGDASDEDAVTTFLVGLGAETLATVVSYHVSAGAKTAADIAGLDTIETLGGETIVPALPRLIDNEPDLLDPAVSTADLAADNGIIHVIDRVLLPIDLPDNDVPTLAGTLVAVSGDDGPDTDPGDFDLLIAALGAAGLVEALDDPAADFTAFAPTDAAFAGLAGALGFDGDATDEAGALGFALDALTLLSRGGDPIPLLTDVLLYHVAPESLISEQVLGATEIPTLLGAPIGVSGTFLVDGDPDLPNPGIVDVDIQTANGIAHVIDGVLIPVDLLPSAGADDVDFIVAGDEDDTIDTGADRDFVDGNGGDDEIDGGGQLDVLLGGEGDDDIDGGAFRDFISGDEGNDTLDGGNGRDTIKGSHGADEIDGGAKGDILRGGGGDDSIEGGAGDDVVFGGKGDDDLEGGAGDDRFVFRGSVGDDVIDDFGAGDLIDLTGFAFPAVVGVKEDLVEDVLEDGILVLATGTVTFANIDDDDFSITAEQFVL